MVGLLTVSLITPISVAAQSGDELKALRQEIESLKAGIDAVRAAAAAECAGDQGKYWQMHEKLFANQQALGANDLARYAQETGVEPGAFKKCVDADAHGAKIRKDLADAQAAGITGTPTFFLGFAESGGKVKVVRRIQGAQPYPVFKAAIDGLLAEGAKK